MRHTRPQGHKTTAMERKSTAMARYGFCFMLCRWGWVKREGGGRGWAPLAWLRRRRFLNWRSCCPVCRLARGGHTHRSAGLVAGRAWAEPPASAKRS